MSNDDFVKSLQSNFETDLSLSYPHKKSENVQKAENLMDTISTEVYVEFGISDVIDIVESSDDAQRVELSKTVYRNDFKARFVAGIWSG